jgi:hypothetical protein
MVIEEKGIGIWDEIQLQSGIGPAHLISAECYDDAITYTLLAAVGDYLSLKPDEALVRFGRYWVRFVESGSFKHIMDFTGKDIQSFVANLDRMHGGVQVVLPRAIMPAFRVVDSAPGRISIAYSSPRSGLEPFVLGLLEGLLERFGLTGAVAQSDQIGGESIFVLGYELDDTP